MVTERASARAVLHTSGSFRRPQRRDGPRTAPTYPAKQAQPITYVLRDTPEPALK